MSSDLKLLTALPLLCFLCAVPQGAGAQMLTGYGAPVAAPVKEAALMVVPVREEKTVVKSATQNKKISQEKKKSVPVDLVADRLEHDEVTQTVTASGHVELKQSGRTLLADEIVYDLGADSVMARGNVTLKDPSGDVHTAQQLMLSDEMRSGFVDGLQSWLANGGHFEAEEGRKEGDKIIMKNASYTPCECDQNEGELPGWLIRAKEVTYHQDENRVTYKDASVEVLGVPVFWSPYLGHPDGKIKRKSGFLTPGIGLDSELGLTVTSNYYWALAPDRDATTGVMLTSQESPVFLAGYRQRYDRAEIEFDGSVTNSSRTESDAGVDVAKGNSWRGHMFSKGKWDMNDKWRSGYDLELTSDDQYLRQYNFSGKDVLENQVFAERFSGRNYAVGRVLSFQDVRIGEERTDQPSVLPEIKANFLGDPNEMLGGRWSLDLSYLGLARDGNGQDVNRLSTELGWQKKIVLSSGLVNTLEASVRGDAYHIADRQTDPPGGPGQGDNGNETRVFPRIHAVSSYPVAKSYEKAQAVIEPVAAVTIAPDVNGEDRDIPNEDSQDVQIDATNILTANRFPGMDRIEDGTHLTYGLRTGLYGYGGSYIDVFAGQSHRFKDSGNPFPAGSGLEGQDSDYVGQIAGVYDGRYGINYRFQLDNDDLSPQRHEADVFADWGRVAWNTRYLFAKALEGTDIQDNREQIENKAAFLLTRKWRLRGSALHDLGEEPGLRRAAVGLDYLGCCVTFSTTAERTLTRDSSGDSGTEITFRIGLKGLGEFDNSNGNGWGARNH